MLECQCNLLCCHVHPQIFQHLRYTTVKDQQVWIVRILFIIPIYGLCSWFGLWITNGSVYFDAVRGCYEGRISLCNVPSFHSDFVHAFVVSMKPYTMQTIDGLWFWGDPTLDVPRVWWPTLRTGCDVAATSFPHSICDLQLPAPLYGVCGRRDGHSSRNQWKACGVSLVLLHKSGICTCVQVMSWMNM